MHFDDQGHIEQKDALAKALLLVACELIGFPLRAVQSFIHSFDNMM